MELALYCPIHGFYEGKRDTIGARGDYYTSVSVGSLFGELLAWQFAQWLTECRQRQSPAPAAANTTPPAREHSQGQNPLQLVEAGAHTGELARDILGWMAQWRPELFAGVEYCLVEPSAQREEWQRQTLGQFEGKVRWVRNLSDLSRPGLSRPLNGVVFSNELLDALPVRRWGWDGAGQHWFEWGVTLDRGMFTWVRLETPPGVKPPGNSRSDKASAPGLPGWLPCQALPDGYTLETNAAAEAWWREAASLLNCGRLLTLDYGLTADELWAPERTGGTLRAYRRHRVSHDVLAEPGEQDLTAHVNFSALQSAGEAAGLQTELLSTQEQFLTRLAGRICEGKSSFGEWTAARRRQLQRLTHPEHLGRALRVLVQRCG